MGHSPGGRADGNDGRSNRGPVQALRQRSRARRPRPGGRRRRDSGLPRSQGAGETTTIRLLLGLIRPTAGRAEIFGLDCQRQVVEAHRRLAYVAGEARLWPSLTGAETLHLLGRVQGRVDDIYRGELIERFDLDPSKKVRAYSDRKSTRLN